jgi:hypothetical protein
MLGGSKASSNECESPALTRITTHKGGGLWLTRLNTGDPSQPCFTPLVDAKFSSFPETPLALLLRARESQSARKKPHVPPELPLPPIRKSGRCLIHFPMRPPFLKQTAPQTQTNILSAQHHNLTLKLFEYGIT